SDRVAIYMNRPETGNGTGTKTVGHHQSALRFNDVNELRDMQMAPDHHATGTVLSCTLLLLNLAVRRLEVAKNQVFGRCKRGHDHTLKLGTRNGRIRPFSDISDLPHNPAETVPLADGFHQRSIAHVHTEMG